ncbi:hypothetical protein Acsp03_19100 [Actinomadura sp. NBRC 104412]|nr:hypothetical protein Acsp03_19100 [Actinomadura sp. NBRC 104412]
MEGEATMTGQRGAAGHEEPTPAEARAATVRSLQSQFPGVRVWYGEATGSWWAMVPLRSGPRLVEAPTPQEIRDIILHLRNMI